MEVVKEYIIEEGLKNLSNLLNEQQRIIREMKSTTNVIKEKLEEIKK